MERQKSACHRAESRDDCSLARSSVEGGSSYSNFLTAPPFFCVCVSLRHPTSLLRLFLVLPTFPSPLCIPALFTLKLARAAFHGLQPTTSQPIKAIQGRASEGAVRGSCRQRGLLAHFEGISQPPQREGRRVGSQAGGRKFFLGR